MSQKHPQIRVCFFFLSLSLSLSVSRSLSLSLQIHSSVYMHLGLLDLWALGRAGEENSVKFGESAVLGRQLIGVLLAGTVSVLLRV